MKLYTRPIQQHIEIALSDTPVVSIVGPRQVGKSTLAKTIAPNRAYISLDDSNYRELAQTDPHGFIDSLPEQVTIDEIQRAPSLMLAIKKSVDENRKPGRFLLTGSANVTLLKQARDSLAGRHEAIHLAPLTSHEVAEADPEQTFTNALLGGRLKPKLNAYPDTLEHIKSEIFCGGYPEARLRSETRRSDWFESYLHSVVNKDVPALDDIRNPDALMTVLRLAGLRTASLVDISSIARDAQITSVTAKAYLSALQRLFLVQRLPAWSNNARKRLVKSAKIHLADAGMACFLNELSLEQWLSNATTFGHIIESYAVQQIRTQLSWLQDRYRVSHYRDRDGREVDLVIEQGDNVWGVEMKRAASIQNADLKGMKVLADAFGDRWRGGVVLYSGDHIMPTKLADVLAVPYGVFWHGYQS